VEHCLPGQCQIASPELTLHFHSLQQALGLDNYCPCCIFSHEIPYQVVPEQFPSSTLPNGRSVAENEMRAIAFCKILLIDRFEADRFEVCS